MDLEAIKYIKQISKKKVSLDNFLQRINKTSATNTDIGTLRIDVDNMLCNGIIGQDYKILKNHFDGDVTLGTIHSSTESTSNKSDNKNTDLLFPLIQKTPKKSDENPTTLVTNELENNKPVTALPFISIQESPTSKTQSTLSVHENNQKTFRLELDDISANIIALKTFLMNEIYDLRQELNQPIKSLNK